MKRIAPFLGAFLLCGSAIAQTCDPKFWQHVYKPSRLTILADCITLTGVIEHRRHEPDADWHIQLKLDPEFADLHQFTQSAAVAAMETAWARNVAKQHSDLVIEPICIGTVRQADAKKPCKGAPQIKVPTVGDHVRVTGPFIIDTSPNHGWLEIHAPTMMEIIP